MKAGALLPVEVTDAIGLALNFAAQNAAIEFVDNSAKLLDVAHGLAAIVGENALEPLRRGNAFVVVRIGRIVAQQFVLGEDRASIDPKAIYAAAHPEAQHVGHRGAHRGVAPVEIGLLLQKGVIIVLPCGFIPLPRAAAEPAQPIVGWAAVLSRVGPEIPITFRA